MIRVTACTLALSLALPAEDAAEILRSALGAAPATWQAPPQPSTQKYKLTIVEDASTFRRAKKGRASSQAVVKVTDENDKPIAGIVVAFAIPQATGASFTGGAMTATATTSSAGLASAGVAVTPVTTNFTISVSATVAGTPLSASIPVSGAAASAAASGSGGAAAAGGAAGGGAGGGISGATIGIIVAAVAGGAVAAAVAVGGGGNNNGGGGGGGGGVTPTPGVRIGIGGATVIGPR